MIVLLAGQKGGTGKSTLCVNLAGHAAARGRDVALLDLDPQGTSMGWAEERDAAGLPSVAAYASAGAVARRVQDLGRRCELLFVDLGGRDSATLQGALSVAEVALVPVRPSPPDVATLGLIDDRVLDAKAVNPSLRAIVFLNAASPLDGGQAVREAREAMANLEGLTQADLAVFDRKAWRRALDGGRTVAEVSPVDVKAVEELAALYCLATGERS